jgi:lysophospholipase L1-like esterase
LTPALRRAAGRAILLLLSSLACFGTVELYLRARYPGSIDTLDNGAFTRVSTRPGQMTELIPGAENPDFVGGPVRVNAHGFRGAEFSQKTPGVARVLAVGDSVTFGYGVAESEVFHAQLAARRNDRGARVEVINAGLPGAGLPYYYHLLRRQCAALEPDLVLIGIVLNDITDYPAHVLEDVPLGRSLDAADPGRLRWLLDRSYALTEVTKQMKSALYRVGVLDLKDSPGYRFPPLESPGAEVEAAWTASTRVLDRIADEARRCGAPFTFLLFPLEVQLAEEALAQYRDGLGLPLHAPSALGLEPQARLAAWAAGAGVPLVDLTPAFQTHPHGDLYLHDLYVSLDPVHPSPLGHAQAAAALDTALTQLGLP